MLTEIRISRAALTHNVRAFRRVLKPNVQLMTVVKSNAYGHGIGECAPVFDNAGAQWFGVASVTEALALRKIIRLKPICVLSFVDVDDAHLVRAMRQKIRLPIYTLAMLKRYNRVARKARTLALVHLKFDTGTTRIGFAPKDVSAVLGAVRRSRFIETEGVYSHFAEVESNHQGFTRLQHARFATLANQLEIGLEKRLMKHIDCSAGVLMQPGAQYDLVRVGMSLYGIHTVVNLQQLHKRYPRFQLQPALRWFTKVIQVQRVPAGTSIGYNRTYITKQPSKIAVLPVGYWDGLDRRLSNGGTLSVGSKPATIRGRVCMNLCMVEVPMSAKVSVGTSVELIGPNNPVEVMSQQCGTIPYEILTRLNPLLPRRVI